MLDELAKDICWHGPTTTAGCWATGHKGPVEILLYAHAFVIVLDGTGALTRRPLAHVDVPSETPRRDLAEMSILMFRELVQAQTLRERVW